MKIRYSIRKKFYDDTNKTKYVVYHGGHYANTFDSKEEARRVIKFWNKSEKERVKRNENKIQNKHNER